MIKDLHLEDIRREYSSRSLSRKEMPEEPIALVQEWISQAIELKVNEPTAMLVCTATSDARPSIRTVLLKEVLNGNFIFYSNYDSRKGEQIKQNPHIALSFLWHELERQIHIEGEAYLLDPKESDRYFDMRPYKNRIGARISPQSHPIPSREFIMLKFAAESLRFAGRHIPRPDNWGGYAVRPSRIEFWQGRDSRLHDRFCYEITSDGSWSLQRLAP